MILRYTSKHYSVCNLQSPIGYAQVIVRVIRMGVKTRTRKKGGMPEKNSIFDKAGG